MVFESLDLPNIPKRSRLYHLEPIATGTPYVEGLISYICRLSEAHCLSPGVLIKKEILPSFKKRYSVSIGEVYVLQEDESGISVSSIPKPAYRKNLNEYGLLAWQYLEGLKPLTLRGDLQELIISQEANRRLAGIVGREIGRAMRAWCPECLQNWHGAEHPIYEPLLWSIAVVAVCPTHHKPLQFHCPHCRKAQRPLTARMLVAQCSQCFGWLDVRAETSLDIEPATTELEQQSRIIRQVMEVLSLRNNVA